ncbi:MAG: flagellar basal body P-ring formation chaperone FlgA, partial [Limnohabitans sp.]
MNRLTRVRKSTPNDFMQMLCRLFLALCLLVPGGVVHAQDARASLMEQARQWVATELGQPAGAVQIAPLDERVQVRTCAAGWRLDWPFASRETLRVSCADGKGWNLFLQLRAAATAAPARADASSAGPAVRRVVVTRTALPRGTVLQPEMLVLAEVPQNPALQSPFDQIERVLLSALTRDVSAGVPLQAMDVRRALLVQQGRMAVLNVGQNQGFQISVRVEVLQDGYMGDQVRLRNPDSGRTLTGIVTGLN